MDSRKHSRTRCNLPSADRNWTLFDGNHQDLLYGLFSRAGFSGDANLDGRLDIADGILALQMLVAVNPDAFHAADDINSDEQFGLAEAIAILQVISGLKSD